MLQGPFWGPLRQLDPFPVLVLKAVAVSFIFAYFMLEADQFPGSFKDAFPTPILKKHGLPEDDMSSYKPI